MLGKVLNENSKLKGKIQKENQEALAKISKAAPFTFAQPKSMQEPAIGNKRRREDQGQRTKVRGPMLLLQQDQMLFQFQS